jgi:Zn-dependent alcohol dehydrogenase
MDSQGGFTNPAQDIPNYLGLYKAGKLNLDGLITHRFGLDDVNEAMNVAYSGKAIRVILEMK